jgi:hypothetical protein
MRLASPPATIKERYFMMLVLKKTRSAGLPDHGPWTGRGVQEIPSHAAPLPRYDLLSQGPESGPEREIPAGERPHQE